MDALHEFILPAGTVCKRNGVPFELVEDTRVRAAETSQRLIEADAPADARSQEASS